VFFHITFYINPRPISSRGPIWESWVDRGCDMEKPIWCALYENLIWNI